MEESDPITIMSFIRYKKFENRRYAYEVTSCRDPEKKRPRRKTKYLGVVDKEKKIFRKKKEVPCRTNHS